MDFIFKKIELWIVLLIIILLLIFTFTFGFLVRQELEGSTKFGKFSKSALEIARIPGKLKYALSTQNVDPQFIENTNEKNINIIKKLETEHLYLMARFSQKYQQGIIELRKLSDLELIHEYIIDQNKFFKLIDNKENFESLKTNSYGKRFKIGSPIIDNDGKIIATAAGTLFKIDLCNNFEWVNNKVNVHHSLNINENGNYLSPIIINSKQNKYSEYFGNDYLDDAIGIFSNEGKLLSYKSISEILIENNYIGFLLGMDRGLYEDPIHLNDIEPVFFDTKYFKSGDLFLSLRHRSAIIHYRPKNNKIIDLIIGPFSHQHDVDILDEKTISIFNNNNITKLSDTNLISERNYKNNEILIYDLEDKKFSKLINNSLNKENISTPTQGLHEINEKYILIEEHDNGRIFLFNKNGEIYWKFNNIENDKKSLISWGKIIKNKNKINDVIKSVNNKKCIK
jgi:hypothetical protein